MMGKRVWKAGSLLCHNLWYPSASDEYSCGCPFQRFNLSVLFLFLLPFSFLYASAAWLNRRLKNPASFDVPVIAVGNLTVGGTGKTPVTVYLSRLLLSLGKHPVILTRGYGSGNEGKNFSLIAGKSHTGESLSVFQVGDEAMEMSLLLPDVPVLAGADRKGNLQNWLKSKEGKTCDVVLLDDGLQHHAIKKDLSICLLDAERGLGNGFPLPAGALREALCFSPLPDILLWTRVKKGKETGSLPSLPVSLQRVPQVLSRFEITSFYPVLSEEGETALPVSAFSGQPVLLVSGLGHNAQFRRSIEEEGMIVVKHLCYSDHFSYTEEDAASILTEAEKEKAEIIVTTGKDSVKLRPFLLKHQGGVKWFSASLSLCFLHEEEERGLLRRMKQFAESP